MTILKIIKLKVKKQIFFVTLTRAHLGEFVTESLRKPWINAYVYLENKNLTEADCCTYHEGHVYGVDTVHWYHDKMSLDEKEEDAIRQIKQLIESSFKKNKRR